MLNKQSETSPATVAMVLKALLSGQEIETSTGLFKYFKRGDWIALSEDTEGEIAEDGIFKRCDVIRHQLTPTLSQVDEINHRWLLWIHSLADFIHWAETISPQELAIIAANLTLNNKQF
jgi:hypothetical protein